jgi:hypothetical protein
MATLTATASAPGGYVGLELTGGTDGQYTITRTDANGNVDPVRNGDPAVYSGGWVGQDFEAPLDELLTYTATMVESPFTVTTATAVTLAADDGLPWLTHPGKPSLSMRILPADFILGARPGRSMVFAVLGRRRGVGQSIARGGYEGELILRITGQAELDDLDALLDDGAPLLLRGPASWIGYGNRYLQIGEVRLERLTRVGTDGRFLATLAFIEVDRPAGTAEGGAGFRWDDVIDAYDTWDDLVADKATWLDVMAGV